MIKSGTQTVAVSAAALNPVLVASIAAALAAVAPSGSLADLAIKTIRAAKVSSDVIAVLDFGRNDVTIVKHSAGALSSLVTAISGVVSAARFNLIPDVTNASSAKFLFQRGADNTDILDTVTPSATPALTPMEIELAAALNPALSKASVSQLLRDIESALDTTQLEGFVLLDTNAQTVTLWECQDTSVIASLQTEASVNGIANMPAASFVSRLHMEPAAASVSSTELI